MGYLHPERADGVHVVASPRVKALQPRGGACRSQVSAPAQKIGKQLNTKALELILSKTKIIADNMILNLHSSMYW